MTALTFFPVSGDYQSVNDPEPQSTTSVPPVQPISGLVEFRPRLPVGFVAYVSSYQVSQNTNCEQTITLIGAITGGTYKLEFSGVWTATGIAPGATAAAVQTALAALSTIGTGNVTVTGPNGGPYQVTFVGALANKPLPQMVADASGLTASSGTPAVSVVMLQGGSTSRQASTAIALPIRTGRIWTSGQLCTIDVVDSPNVQLAANSAALGLTFPLIYDVTFTSVYFNGQNQSLAPFAFTAPVDTSPICITDPALTRLPYEPPIQETWYPGWTPDSAGSSRTVTPLRRDWRKAG